MKLFQTQTRSLDVFDALLAMKLAETIHGTDDAIRHTAKLCRDKIRAEHRPLFGEFQRHPKIREWLQRCLEAL